MLSGVEKGDDMRCYKRAGEWAGPSTMVALCCVAWVARNETKCSAVEVEVVWIFVVEECIVSRALSWRAESLEA